MMKKKTPEETMEIARRMGHVDLYSAVFVFDVKHRPLLSRMYRERSLSRVALGPLSYLMRVVDLDDSKGYLHVVMQTILSTCCKEPLHEDWTAHSQGDDPFDRVIDAKCSDYGVIYGRCSDCGKREVVSEYETKT